MKIRPYEEKGLPAMTAIRNEVVAAGAAFPQTEPLHLKEARSFFASQARSAIAETDSGEAAGLCILHPNHIGRCGHIANSPYAVSSARRGEHLGEARIRDCLHADWDCGFRLPDGSYEDILFFYHTLEGLT